ncbi:MAG: IS4 family transposase [Planctomycetaceae bacterium]|jgi:hypothetical protein|nr:IS4 family transposase [Planctomycetaceae bacterium]
MGMYDRIFERYETKGTFAVLVRTVLQRLMPSDKLNQVFEESRNKQYHRTLAFSTCMEIMFGVVLGTHQSVNDSYLDIQDEVPVSLKSVYNKLNSTDPEITTALIRYSVEQLMPIQKHLLKGEPKLLPGYPIRIIDGNHLSGTEHRIEETRANTASPLPGFTLAILDPDNRMIIASIPCEDGHAQERSLTSQILERVCKGELWIADRNFTTIDIMSGISAKGGFFLMRQHGSLKNWRRVGRKEKYVGKTDTGKVYQQNIIVTKTKTGEEHEMRRIRIVLNTPTQDGDTEIVLFTNLDISVDSVRCSELYRERWSIESAFGEMTSCLSCEIHTLGYPKAALLAFALAVIVYNAVAVVKGAILAAHGKELMENLSWYFVYMRVRGIWDGMEIAIPFEYWSERFDNKPPKQFAMYLKSLAERVDISKYQKKQRGIKKKVKKKSDPKVNHVSTYQILKNRKNNKK